MLTYERAHELLSYDPESGALTWNMVPGYRRKAGTVAGSINKSGRRPRVVIVIDGRWYLAHRVIYLMQAGRWPLLIDHINLDSADNSWRNLREADYTQNNMNQPKKKSRFTTLKGVSFDRKANRYYAHIKCRGVNRYLGCFKTEAEAHEAYKAAAPAIAGEFARLA